MLYFEDFMEDIEDLPYEFKENLTAIRQLDLQVQNIMDPLDGRIIDFFQKCSQNSFLPSQHEQEYEKILKEFEEVDSKNVDKIAITNQMKDTFYKMIKKMDTELGKFKLELEADNPGSAEAIERMVNQQIKSGVSDVAQRCERKRIKRGRMVYDLNMRSQLGVRKFPRSNEQSDVLGLKSEKSEFYTQNSLTNQSNGSGVNDALMTTAVANGSLSPASSLMGSLNTPHSVKRKFDWRNAASNPNDKAIKLERKRHKMLSTMSDDSESNMGTNDELGIDEAGNASLFEHNLHSSSAANDLELTRKSVQSDCISEAGSGRTPASLNFGMSYSSSGGGCGGDLLLSSGAGGTHVAAVTEVPLSLDHDVLDHDQGNEEPRYCFCNDVSYGDMIACDSPNCPREWFHYGCVNLTIAPKGSWFCRDCKTKGRQRR